MEQDASLENLLLLDGEIMAVGGGFSAKFVARRVPANEERPHGVMYSLTLHGRIANIQTSWVKLGVEGTRAMLNAGANAMNE